MGTAATIGSRALRGIIFSVDAVQRRRHHVFEFEQDPRCILRIGRCPSPEDQVLSDGTIVHAGDPIVEIHFWNEHMHSCIDGSDLGWGVRFYGEFRRSLEQLAHYMGEHPEFNEVVAIRGESSFASTCWDRYEQFCGRLGFDFTRMRQSTGPVGRFFMNLYVWLLVWVVNPTSLQGRPLTAAERGALWMSREAFLARYCKRTPRRQSRERRPALQLDQVPEPHGSP